MTEKEIKENEDRRRKGLEEMLKDLKQTIDRTDKAIAGFNIPGKK